MEDMFLYFLTEGKFVSGCEKFEFGYGRRRSRWDYECDSFESAPTIYVSK